MTISFPLQCAVSYLAENVAGITRNSLGFDARDDVAVEPKSVIGWAVRRKLFLASAWPVQRRFAERSKSPFGRIETGIDATFAREPFGFIERKGSWHRGLAEQDCPESS